MPGPFRGRRNPLKVIDEKDVLPYAQNAGMSNYGRRCKLSLGFD